MRGCNNFCTYCIVPYTRGPQVEKDPGLIDEEIAAIREEMRQKGRSALERLFVETGITAPPENIHLLQGETSTVIDTAIDELEADVLVMGTLARAGVPGLLIGNKAEKILSQISCTVMAVKPDGFLSPVKL